MLWLHGKYPADAISLHGDLAPDWLAQEVGDAQRGVLCVSGSLHAGLDKGAGTSFTPSYRQSHPTTTKPALTAPKSFAAVSTAQRKRPQQLATFIAALVTCNLSHSLLNCHGGHSAVDPLILPLS